MTISSFICNFISSHPDKWESELKTRNIRIKRENNLSIFNYDIGADFFDPIVQEARGIIVDTDKIEVVCWPFRKFCNSHESAADDIDWESARVQEKVDGSIAKLWFDKEKEEWVWSSNSCIRSEDAVLQTGVSLAYLIRHADNYFDIDTDILNKGYTYIFELVGPMNQVVVRYPCTSLYHIGTKSNITGQEMSVDIGIKKPKEYSLHSLDDCMNAARELNKGDYPDNEGFVVVDKDWHRIKVKSPEYLIYHHAVNNGVITKEKAWEILHTDDFNMDEFLKAAPEHVIKVIEYYDKSLREAKFKAVEAIEESRRLVVAGFSRKEIALSNKANPYSMFIFKGLDSDDSPEIIVSRYEKKLLGLVEEYLLC